MIKDNIQPQSLGGYKLPKLKGTVEIKLHNPTTGKTEIHRGENMITNAVSDIFASNYCGVLDYRSFLPLYNTMYGGILCFSKQLNVDTEQGAADDYFIPDNHPTYGNPVTAHAGQTSFSKQADDYTRGIPSNVTATDGTVTFSWEWGLSAGNGTIQALALTHTDVGDAGTGSTSQAFQNLVPFIPSTSGIIKFWHGGSGSGGGATHADYNIPAFVHNNYGYYFYTTAGTQRVTIVKFPLAYNKAGITNNLLKTNDLSTVTEITTTTSWNGKAPFYYYDEINNRLWLFYNTSVSINVSCEEINLNNMTATNHNFVLTGANGVGPLCNYIPLPITVYDGYAYFTNMNNGTSMCRIKLSNFADVSNIQMAQTNQYKWASCFIPIGTRKILASKNYVINNGVCYQCNAGNVAIGHTGTNGYYYVFPFMESKLGLTALGGFFHYVAENPFRVDISKFYLGTKYNLQSAVTKTPSQSMIVTYTLTEVAP